MPRPKGNDWLEDEILHLKAEAVDELVSLLQDHEIMELGLKNEEAYCQEHDVVFTHFPIPDRDTPRDPQQFGILAKRLKDQLKLGKKIVIHCRMGIGRASLLAAATLIAYGVERRGIFNKIAEFRELDVPDTEEQFVWLINESDNLITKKM